jgi:4-hydroxyphenylpyruvate dioxygenase
MKMSTTCEAVSSTVRIPDLVAGFDFAELYVGNAQQAAHFFHTAFGFDVVQRSGLDTGFPDATVFLLKAGEVQLVLSSPLGRGPIADHVNQHGDSVKDIALLVENLDEAFDRAVKAGAASILTPRPVESATHTMRKATVGTPGDIVHTLVQREKGVPLILGNAKEFTRGHTHRNAYFRAIDHIALAVERGRLETWVDYYKSVFDFEITHEEKTATEFTAMRSVVVENRSRTVKFPIVEPADGKKRSQIEDFLGYHNGPGAQHLALLCDDIESVVQDLRAHGVEFLEVPDNYYDALPSRLDLSDRQTQSLREARLLIDQDEWGDLIQTFSKPVTSRPTLFFELVQRNGARGFGGGNIRALFEAIEREQSARAGW